MKWFEWIGLIASIISISGAIFSLRNLNAVKRTKTEIFGLFKVLKFNNVNENTQTTLEQIRKICHKPKIPRGTNVDEIIASLNNYFEKIYKLTNEEEVENSTNLKIQIQNYRSKINQISAIKRSNENEMIQSFNEIYEMTLSINQEFEKLTKKIIEK